LWLSDQVLCGRLAGAAAAAANLNKQKERMNHAPFE
jgi:hypothetical protein